MGLVDLIFGRPPKGRSKDELRIDAPPSGVEWRSVRWREANPPVRAELAKRNGAIRSARGALRYRRGQHYIIETETGERSAVRRDIFEQTYRQRPDGAYEKRSDLIYRYFTLTRPAIITTLEGQQRAEPGDWIMQGVSRELWPIRADEAEAHYVAA